MDDVNGKLLTMSSGTGDDSGGVGSGPDCGDGGIFLVVMVMMMVVLVVNSCSQG